MIDIGEKIAESKVVISILRRSDGNFEMKSNMTLTETMRALASTQIGLINQLDKPVIERV